MISDAVTLAQLRALVAVIDEGGIGRAAVRLGLAQSAVSQHLTTLERVVALRLLERRPGPVAAAPTEAATALAEHARAVLARVDVLGADAASLRAEGAGRVRLGCFMSVGARILPRVLAEVGATNGELRVEVVERDADDELLDDIASCALDLAFTTLPVRPGPFATIELLRDPHVLLVPADHPLAARRAAPRLDELAQLPLIGFRKDFSEEQRVDGVFRARGHEPRVVLRTDNNLAIPELVAAGLGCAVLPRLALPEVGDDPRLRVIGLARDAIADRRIGLTWHADRRLWPAARALRDIAVAVCADITPASARGSRSRA